MSCIRIVMLLCGIALIGCSSEREEPDKRTGANTESGRLDSTAVTTTHADSAGAPHLAHESTAVQRAGNAHAKHGAAAKGRAHRNHVAAPSHRERPLHAQHAAPEAHAAHAPAQRDSALHAAQPPARADSAHAHAQAPHDTMAHAAQPADSVQQHAHATPHDSARSGQHEAMQHNMPMLSLGGGWMAVGMAQLFPTATISLPADQGTPLDRRGLYLTQPALMFNVESPGSGISLRTTLNFEGITQPSGELTFGGWGEGYLDKRHPHTFLHEAMLSANFWASDGGGFSLSAGKGFAPFGTDDPMSRPVVKYPTNHHLSQVLERFTLNAVITTPLWGAEVGVFGGNEPTGPWDFSNIESFANSWSARVSRHIGIGTMHSWTWEVAASFARIKEQHEAGEAPSVTRLFNAMVRHEKDYGFGNLYGLLEGSWSDPREGDGYHSLLAELSLQHGSHKPYARIESATRPEYARAGSPDTRGFFRYDHDAEPIGSTRWLTVVVGYGVTATSLPFSARPYIEAQWSRVSEDRGNITPVSLFGRSSFASVSAGFRVLLGGEPMRMGAYGVLDAMTLMHRMEMVAPPTAHPH